MSLSLTACGDDDDSGSSSSSSQSVSAIKTSDGKTVLLKSVGEEIEFGYDSLGRCTTAKNGNLIEHISYDPFTISDNQSSRNLDISLNKSGYIERYFRITSDGDSIDCEFSYDSSGHLKLATMTIKQGSDIHVFYDILEWSNGNLISVQSLLGYSDNLHFDRVLLLENTKYKYSSTKNYNVYPCAYDRFPSSLALTGLLGKGPANLPSMFYSTKYFDGNELSSGMPLKVSAGSIDYTLNSDGTIKSESVELSDDDVRNYTYTTLSE